MPQASNIGSQPFLWLGQWKQATTPCRRYGINTTTMANTYTQIYMHVIFAVKGRESMIRPEWQDDLYRYMAGALKNHEHTPYIINGMEDHVHLLFGMTPKESLSELVQSLKIQSTKHIKEQYGCLSFAWQSGFGAFSYSKSFLPAVSNYIANQKEHHKKRSFDDEMREILEKAEIEYDERYILKGVTKPTSDT